MKLNSTNDPQERIYLKICKILLGIHRKTSNLAVYSEKRRYPIYFDQILHTTKYTNYLKHETLSLLVSQIRQFYARYSAPTDIGTLHHRWLTDLLVVCFLLSPVSFNTNFRDNSTWFPSFRHRWPRCATYWPSHQSVSFSRHLSRWGVLPHSIPRSASCMHFGVSFYAIYALSP